MSQLAQEPDVVDAYQEYRQLLVRIACGRFFVPEDEAEGLVHEVFMSYIRCARGVADRRAWLVAAICNASRTYWRRNARYSDRDAPAGNDDGDAAQSVEDATRVSQILSRLSERDQHVLRLHYLEGYSAVEIAKILETTPRYAEKLVHVCLTRARKLFEEAI